MTLYLGLFRNINRTESDQVSPDLTRRSSGMAESSYLNSGFLYKKNVPRMITYFLKLFEYMKIILTERYTKIELVCT